MAGDIHELMITNKKNWVSIVFWVIPVLFLLAFFFHPLLQVALRSIIQPDAWTQFSPSNLRIAWRSIRFSFLQAALSMIMTACLGIPAAYLFGRFRFPGRNALRVASTLPFILPTVVVAAAFNALLGSNGWLNLLLMRFFSLSQPPIQMFGTLSAIILAHMFYNTSIFIRVVGTAWERLDPNIEDASRILSSSPWRTFMRITLPLLLPSIISAMLLVFLFDFTSFGVILLMGGVQFATMEVEIYIQTTQFLNLKLAGFLASIQLLFSIAITYFGKRLDEASFAPIMPVMSEKGLRKPTTIWKKVFVLFMVIVLVVFMVVPLTALVFRATMVQTADGSAGAFRFSIANFQRIFVNERDALFFVPPFVALRNSALYAFSAMLIALTIGVFIVVGSGWSSRIRSIMDAMVMLPLGTSAVTLGLGYLLAFSSSRSMVVFYPFLIPIAHALIALPFVVRIIQPAINAIPSNQHEVAVVLGISPNNLWWKLDLPIIRKPLITAAIYSFAISLGEFGATTFLTRPEIPTLPVAIFRYFGLPGQENYGKALAMSVILLAACAVGFLIIENLQETQGMD
jgi:thiamine transport system permease protein